MSYSVKQGDIFGRIGSAIGKGLEEQVPKEVERLRLSQGLEQLGKESAGLTPFQKFSKLLGIPGAMERPQLLQSAENLLRQEGISQAYKRKAGEEGLRTNIDQNENISPRRQAFRNQEEGLRRQPVAQETTPSLTTRTPIEAELKPYIPKDLSGLQKRAGELQLQDPELYPDAQSAFQGAFQEDQQQQLINQALLGQGTGERAVQSRIVNGLSNQNERLGSVVPGNVYDEIENKAINAVKPKSEGGEGLTELQAQKKYGKELDRVSRNYQDIATLGNFNLFTRSPTQNRNKIKAIRKSFLETGDTENLADSLIAKNGLSAPTAYYFANPVSSHKELNNTILKLPKLVSDPSFKKDIQTKNVLVTPNKDAKTLEVSKKLAPLLGKDASPLSVSLELKNKGYNPDVWLKYLDDNRKKVNLTERQASELNKPSEPFLNLNDLWIMFGTGLDELTEQP